jgi:hypothetical protein
VDALTRDEARTQLATLAQASTEPTLSNADLDVTLTASRLPDNESRPPSDPDFVEENWDLNYAAAECYELKAARFALVPWLKQFTSESATFIKDRPDFQAMADWYRDHSTTGGDSSAPSFIALDNRLPWRLRPRSELDC